MCWNGRCDLVCPVDTMHYAIDHMPLDPKYRDNVTAFEQFDAGHMMSISTCPTCSAIARRSWKVSSRTVKPYSRTLMRVLIARLPAAIWLKSSKWAIL